MELEWDDKKRQDTLRERGLDFADIAFIDQASLVSERDTRHEYGEVRFSSFAYLDGRLIKFLLDSPGGPHPHHFPEESQ